MSVKNVLLRVWDEIRVLNAALYPHTGTSLAHYELLGYASTCVLDEIEVDGDLVVFN